MDSTVALTISLSIAAIVSLAGAAAAALFYIRGRREATPITLTPMEEPIDGRHRLT